LQNSPLGFPKLQKGPSPNPVIFLRTLVQVQVAVSYSSSGTHGTYKTLPTQVKVRFFPIIQGHIIIRETLTEFLSPITTVTEFNHHRNRIQNRHNRIKTTAQILNFIPVPPHSSSNIQNQYELLENQNRGVKFNEVLWSLVRSQRFSTKIIIIERFSFAFLQFKSKGRSQENWRKRRREIEEESNQFEEEED
jgi:hypothetical protein